MKLSKRVTVARVERFLTQRADAIKAEMRHYEDEAVRVPDQFEFYKKMAATERCAWMEVLHIRDVICGGKHDPRWTAGLSAITKEDGHAPS